MRGSDDAISVSHLLTAANITVGTAVGDNFPWNSDSPVHPLAASDGQNWPWVTIITPSFQQGAFVEATIRSVLLQGYPKLEYMVMDGGSTDGTVDVVKHYSPFLAYWVSVPDAGQSSAINHGIQRGTGEFVAWLNSDDLYLPGFLVQAVAALMKNPQAAMVFGKTARIQHRDITMAPYIDSISGQPWHLAHVLASASNPIPQPSTLIRRTAWTAVGGLNDNLHLSMDWDLWLRLEAIGEKIFIDDLFSLNHDHCRAKARSIVSGRHGFGAEKLKILQAYYNSPRTPERARAMQNHSFMSAHVLAARESLRSSEPILTARHLLSALLLKPLSMIGKLMKFRFTV